MDRTELPPDMSLGGNLNREDKMLVGRVTKAVETKNVPQWHWNFYIMDGPKLISVRTFARKWVAMDYAQSSLLSGEIQKLENYTAKGKLIKDKTTPVAKDAQIAELTKVVSFLKQQLERHNIKTYGEI